MIPKYISTKFLAGILFLLSPTIIHSQRNIDPVLQGEIDDFIRDTYFPRAKVVGLGLAILKDDDILYTTGFGLADKIKGIPFENSTQTIVASITKSVTAVIVGKILNQYYPELGEAIFDTPIVKLIPDANFTLIDRFRTEHTTFRDLISHRMCLFQGNMPMSAGAFNETSDLAYGFRYQEEICGFRSQFQYSNGPYIAAGEAIGILANKSYEDLVQELLDDLGMVDTTFNKVTDDYSQLPNRARPYYLMNNETYPVNPELNKRMSIASAAGGMLSTPNDMAKYLRFHMNFGNVDGKQIVPKEVLEWLRNPSIILPSQTYKSSDDDSILNSFGYGLGFWLGSYDGWKYDYHAGSYPPYASLMSYYPAKNLAIYTSVSTTPVQFDQLILHAAIFEILKGARGNLNNAWRLRDQLDKMKVEEEKRENAEFQAFYENAKEKGKTLEQLEIVGKYGSGSLGELEVYEKFNENENQTQYYLDYGTWYKAWLQHDTNTVYQIKWDTDVIHDNYVNGDFMGLNFVVFEPEGLTIFQQRGTRAFVDGIFEYGLERSELPPIPWSPGSCGPEDDSN